MSRGDIMKAVRSVKSDKSAAIDMTKLIRTVLLKFGSGLVIIGSILFLCAGTIKYWNVWLFLLAVVIPMTGELIYLLKNDPELLRNRMKTKETEPQQQTLVRLSVVFMIIAFIIPGFDYRYQWSQVPWWLVAVGIIMFEIGYLLFTVVLRQNSYASRVIEIQENQKLIDTGLYSLVRHPLYLSSILIDISIPLILGSFYALIPMLLVCAELLVRIKNEEEVLKKGLAGYGAYIKKVKYRLIPFIW
jgi:protein-S-isoprenylcysteine O-methyltransferase Ste14